MQYKLPILLWLALFLIPRLALPSQGITTHPLNQANDVSTEVDKLKWKLESMGFTVPLVIDHSAAAASIGETLSPNQVIFARLPRHLERRLLRKSPVIGIDLPLKFQVYENNGEILLAFNRLGYLIDRHHLHMRDFTLRRLDHLLQQLGGADRLGLETVVSNRPLEETVAALQDAIQQNPDARIPLVVDFSDRFGQRRAGFPVLVVFGNPKVGTPLMQATPAIGIDLPQKFLVWEDSDGRVFITYNDPDFIARRVGLTDQKAGLETLANALKRLAAQGAGVASAPSEE